MITDAFNLSCQMSTGLANIEAPIDLSRRCDSVETRKTPSPYNSSAFGECSPSLPTDSPNSLTRSSSNFATNLSNPRPMTPTNRYQSNASYMQRNYAATGRESGRYQYESDRTPSPPEPVSHHRYMREQSVSSNDDDVNPYFLHAVALQQKLQTIPATVSANGELSGGVDELQFPMVLGRDGKLVRPFKVYPPPSISAAIPSTDSLSDRVSAERFNLFRQQMLEKIHAANGGRPTVTNPKMRRISSKNFGDHESIDVELQKQKHLDEQNQSKNLSDSSDNVSNGKEAVKDSAYYERRRKNNAAAKKSRDRRRIKEDEIAIRAAFLERENFELKIELATAKRQLAKFMEK